MTIALALIVSATMNQAVPASPSPTPFPAPSPSTACPQPSVTLPAALDRVLRDYENAWSRGDEKALASLFTEDGFILQTGNPPLRGRAAIELEYAKSGGQPLSLRGLAFAENGDIAFIVGCYAPGTKEPDQGKFTLTLRKTGAGRWLIFSDMDNTNRRPTRPPVP